MDKDRVTSNDIIEALSIRLNDALRPGTKKTENKKNNGYFWIFKLLIMVLYLYLLVWLFDLAKELGVDIIYEFSKSLRSVLSAIWTNVIDLMKSIIVIYILYDNYKIFTESTYYKNLYKSEQKAYAKKKSIFNIVGVILKAFGVALLVVTGVLSTLALFGLVYLIILFINGIYMISPILISLTIFAIGYFTFKNIQNKFFNGKAVIGKNYFIISFMILIIGILFFGYEISSFEYKNGLPINFELVKKEQTFELFEGQKIEIESDSKLDNLKVFVDNNLENEIKIELEYYRTADVSYIYQFNEYDDLNLIFTSDINYEMDFSLDVLKLFTETFNNKTMYNYNLFKYPNISVYVNRKDLDRISVK